ncbi:MAG TPA: winged helix-turn-helix domain-containing protein [Burkholderiales bacterium]|nr:winged helix-turn-helix domain-containing protein [Burkholderiales bacterium]
METESPPQRLQVGDWTVDAALNQLSAAGKSVKLEPKAMAVLVYLAQRPGEVVSREALLAAVWPGVVVSDDAVTQVVIKLRKALGDAAESPAYIQTISKRGYRLVAPVGPVQQAAVGQKRKGLIPWLAGGGLATAILAGAAFWWGQDEPAQVAALDLEAARAAQPTVTVRPFEALGEDPEAALLARGLTADLVTDLSKVVGLSVIGVAANAESSRYLVTGTVQRVADRVRLHVHLADAQTGKQLWSERFDRPLASFFAIQEELGPKILQIVPAKVSEAELRRMAQRHTGNLEAYKYFQRGQAALLVRRKAENETARDMFRRAIALDANFARAYAALALTYAADYRNHWTVDGSAALERAFELARSAHEMNRDIRETYFALAFVHLERREHAQALRFLETAVQLYPSFADAYAFMGGVKTYMGRPAEGVPLVRTAMRLNPEGSYLYFLILGRAYLALADLEQARVNLEHALRRNPEDLESNIYMAMLHLAAGDQGAAAWKADEIRVLQPGFSSRRWLETHPLIDTAQKRRLVQALNELGL